MTGCLLRLSVRDWLSACTFGFAVVMQRVRCWLAGLGDEQLLCCTHVASMLSIGYIQAALVRCVQLRSAEPAAATLKEVGSLLACHDCYE
jgi:hypothetical protein